MLVAKISFVSTITVNQPIFFALREGHSREDYEDHDISEYRPPRKR